MLQKYIEKAEILLEALPYIQKFAGKTVVIKYGGSAMEDEKLKASVIKDVVLLKYVGLNPVIVHGGGIEITDWLNKLNIKSEFVDGQRKTSPEAMEVIEMVLAGKVNKSLVHLINLAGGKAVGLCGKDAQLIEAQKHSKKDLGLVGDITKINPDIINLLDKEGYIPVISSVGSSPTGESFNINADFAATDIAIALKAEKLISVSNVEGILDKDKKIIKQITAQEIKEHIANGIISGGMIPKVESALNALQNGVNNVHIISGEIPHSILLELFTDYGIGTMIKQ